MIYKKIGVGDPSARPWE